MDSTIIVAIIGAIATTLAAVIAAISSRRKHESAQKILQTVIDTDSSSQTIVINKDEAEKAALLVNSTIEEMVTYKDETIKAFRTIFSELVTNALEHGCLHEKDTIKITTVVNLAYISLIVLNPRGRKFNLDKEIKQSHTRLIDNPSRYRGRGLRLVAEIADTFIGLPNENGVKAVLYKDNVIFNVKVVHE